MRGKKFNISIVFTSQSYFKMSKDTRLKSRPEAITKILKKRELQQIALNHWSDIEFEGYMNLYKDYTKESFSFLMNNTTSPSNNLLRFRRNLLRKSKQSITKLGKRKLNKI